MESNLTREDRNKVGVYVLHNTKTLETYVGSGQLKYCENRHKYGIKNKNHTNRKVKEAVDRNQDGWVFTASPIEEKGLTIKENRDLAFDVEQSILDDFVDKTPLLLNISKDARIPLYQFTQEHKIKIAQANSVRIWKDESRSKLRESVTGRKHTEETRKKISESTKGKVFSEETRNRLSESLKGREPSESTLKIFREANLKRSIPVVANGIIYDSVNSAAKTIGVDNRTIDARCRSTTGNFQNYFYLDKDVK